MWYVHDKNELYHYGVPGMKWGVRKAEAKSDYKKAKRELKDAKKAYRKSVRGFRSYGVEGIARATAAESARNQAAANAASAKAKYNAAKAKNDERSEKREFRTYAREMAKTGLPGSNNDRTSGGRATAIYNKVKAEKGKDYADKVLKNVEKRGVATMVTAAAVAAGGAAVSIYLQLQDG